MDQQALSIVGRHLLEQIGEDPTREGLKETPKRFAKACEEWFGGYKQEPEQILKCFGDGAENHDEMVLQRGIPVWSHCEHHVAPFFGVVHIGYIPSGKIVGLSKLKRLVDCFGHRLQVQERLTQQIATAIHDYVSNNVAVVVVCRHSCMESRGIETAGTETTTSAMLGHFRNDQRARAEFLSFVNAR